MFAGVALVCLAGGIPDFSEVAEKVAGSVVSVRVKRAAGFAASTLVGMGSGAVVDREGHVVTAEHVVRGARSVTVTLRSGEERKAEVTGIDPRVDLAMLKLAPGRTPAPIELGDSGRVKPGQWAIALGSPFGLEDSLTVGVVSSVRRWLPPEIGATAPSGRAAAYYGPLIQTDAPLNPGNSGGPLVDSAGRMVGVSVIIYVTSEKGPRGVGFAVPVNELKKRLRELKRGEPVKYPYLGVMVDEFQGPMALAFGLDAGGALIDAVKDGSPARAAGLKAGEVIRAISGERVGSPGDFASALWRKKPGETIELELASAGGRSRKVRATLAEKTSGGRPDPVRLSPAASTLAWWRGLRLVESESGARVAALFPGSKAAEAGLRAGLVVDEAVAAGKRAGIAAPEDFGRFVEGVSGPVAVHVKGLGYFVIEEE